MSTQVPKQFAASLAGGAIPIGDRLRAASDPADKRELLREYFDRWAEQRDQWKGRNRYYHENVERLCRSLIPAGSRVLDLGCSTGDLLSSLQPDPQNSLGVDLSPRAVAIAARKYPHLRFAVGDAEEVSLPDGTVFDYVVLSDLVGHLHDLYRTFRKLHAYVTPETRVIVTYYNFLWEGVLQLAERFGLKMPQHYQNWLSMADFENLFYLTDFDLEEKGTRLLLPKRVPLLSDLLNKVAPRLPFVRHFCLIQYLVARPLRRTQSKGDYTVSVIVPCRNEAGNIETAASRTPAMGRHTELIYVDGDSTDGTVEQIESVIAHFQGKKDIKLIHQAHRVTSATRPGERPDLMLKLGKGDAVRKGFAAASGDILMILDADLTVAPEDLPKFYEVLAEGKATFVNGSRLVYAMQDQSMRFLNLVGNKMFSLAFSWLLGQRVKDTLCGTKVLFRRDYDVIRANRAYFGEFDPFGDFDLLFGAAHAGMKIVDLPIRYRARVAGVSKVRVLNHGILLLKMTLIGFAKLKLKKWFGWSRSTARG